MNALVVTGTDTGIGKTVAAAMLTLALGAVYWKPVQSGIADGTDTAAVAAMTGLGADRFLPERWRLTEPLSPHRAAELDEVEIEAASLALPTGTPQGRPLVIEGAGGLMVPLNRRTLFIDIFQRWQAPVVLCARTVLGTINHALLSIEALKRREVPILGILFIGDPVPDSERTIVEFGSVRRLGRLPPLPVVNPATLAAAFADHFHASDFRAVLDH